MNEDKTRAVPPSARGAGANAQRQAELQALRGQIDAVDAQLVELLAKRHAVVQQVAAIKQACRLPAYHPAREEDMISERREQARQAGLEPNLVEELYRCILRHSRVRQTTHLAHEGVRPGARVLLVGGGGKMGRYFGRWFSHSGYEVRVLDVADWPRVAELCRDVHLALVCVPIHLTVSVIQRLGPNLPADCLLADITSTKKAPVDAMLAAHGGPVMGLHPVFGPMSATMDKQIVVATPGRLPEAGQWLLDQLGAWGNIVLIAEPDEHDQIMGIVQALRHFATFAFGQFLCQKDVNLSRALEFSSPIYRLELGMVGRFFAQDADLYAEIIFASPETRALLSQFVDSQEGLRELLASGDKDRFCAQFKRVADWFGPFCGQAMRESGFLIEKLVERF
jgi:chorismate mutase/prephenate dehydrogenase